MLISRKKIYCILIGNCGEFGQFGFNKKGVIVVLLNTSIFVQEGKWSRRRWGTRLFPRSGKPERRLESSVGQGEVRSHR
jgi:hypothetical protein